MQAPSSMPSSKFAVRDPWVGAWLALIALMVAGMILLGGATRLTDSGLSITEWRPVTGALPPLSEADWRRAFHAYQSTTQYALVNHGMSLDAFKTLFWWEWAHRFLGRAIGAAFALPFVIFWATGRLKGRVRPVLGLFALGGLQGAIGWWMVKSGLVGRVDVSPIRLAAHLGVAFIILALALRLSLAAFAWPRRASMLGAPRALVWAFCGVLYLQILLGALVAGNDAGRAYSDWPTIGGDWLPRTYAALEPFWRNLVENHAALQFNHRMLGYAAALFALHIAGLGFRRAQGPAKPLAIALGLLALIQAGLGIAAIVTGAPLSVSLVHQGVAVLLWATAIALTRALAWR
ncbi:MAG: COX15/CtaA family protein [Hyphomonadaceae bacterium]